MCSKSPNNVEIILRFDAFECCVLLVAICREVKLNVGRVEVAWEWIVFAIFMIFFQEILIFKIFSNRKMNLKNEGFCQPVTLSKSKYHHHSSVFQSNLPILYFKKAP